MKLGFTNGGQLTSESAGLLAADLAGIQAAGARWCRVQVSWPGIEPTTPGVRNWTSTDAAVDGLISRGVLPLLLIHGSPGWARPTSDPAAFGMRPDNVADYATFVTAAVTRYLARGCHHYELWNEPNLGMYWDPTPNLVDAVGYTALLKAGYRAVKAVDPKAVVVSAGLSGSTDGPHALSYTTFLAQMYAAGAGAYFDALGVHPYTYPKLPGSGGATNFFDNLPNLRAILVANGHSDRHLWITEFGAPTAGTNALTEAQVATSITTAAAMASAWGWIDTFLVHQYRDKGVSGTNSDLNFGLVKNDGTTPKAALAAFKTLTGA